MPADKKDAQPHHGTTEATPTYGGASSHGEAPTKSPKKIRTLHLQQFKDTGEKFTMLTAYDAMTAEIFDHAGVEMLLVGDSAANVMMGQDSTLPITTDELLVYTKSVVRGAQRALVVADLPFGTYEESPVQAVRTGVRFLKEAGAQAVKIEADASMKDYVHALVRAGIPVIAHVGFTPQSEHALGGYRVQGREEQRRKVIDDAVTLAQAGAFAILVEMVPADVMEEIDRAVTVPTIGIGAGPSSTGQVLVWQDMMGLSAGRVPRFVKKYAQLRSTMTAAVEEFRSDVSAERFPASEHTF